MGDGCRLSPARQRPRGDARSARSRLRPTAMNATGRNPRYAQARRLDGHRGRDDSRRARRGRRARRRRRSEPCLRRRRIAASWRLAGPQPDQGARSRHGSTAVDSRSQPSGRRPLRSEHRRRDRAWAPGRSRRRQRRPRARRARAGRGALGSLPRVRERRRRRASSCARRRRTSSPSQRAAPTASRSATTRRRPSSRAGSRRCADSQSLRARDPTRSPASPGWATSS